MGTTGSAALSCCAEACTADPACGGLWWQPKSNSNCLLYGDCSKPEGAAVSGDIFVKTKFIQDYTQTTFDEKKRCALATQISGKPRQCLHTTGSAALSCCAEACTADPACG